MPPVDSHCHLQDAKFDADREEVLARALDALEWIVLIGDDIPTSRLALDLVRPRVYAAVGVHPYHAATVTDEAIDELRAMAANPGVRAIGEIGLDYFKYNDTPRDVQRTGFMRQIDLAVELDLPIVIHNRESDDDLCAILDEHHGRLTGILMHCFPGGAALTERCLKWPNAYISFAGNLTYPKAEPIREAARAVPLERLMVETDAPYLAPQPVRGQRCEPAHVLHTARALAGVKEVSEAELFATVARNAARFFGV